MKHASNKRIALWVLVALVIATFAVCLTLDRQSSIQRAINDLASDPDLKHATISFLITDSGSGRHVASLNPEVSTVRASAQKLFATSMAIEMLGKDYRPSTRFYIDGEIGHGILDGDLWIRGGGDITLGSKYFNEEGREDAFLQSWAETILSLGVTSITGRVIADGSEFGYAGAPDGWSWFDLGNYYGAGPSGICIYDNAMRYVFRSGPHPGDRTEMLRTIPDVPELSFRNFVTSEQVKTINVAFYGAPFSYDCFAVGSLPLSNDHVEARGRLPDPEWRMAVEFVRMLEQKGVHVAGGPDSVRRSERPIDVPYESDMQLMYTHEGPSIEEIVRVTNRQSVNLFAEQLVCLIGYERGGSGTTENGLEHIHNYLDERMDTTGLNLVDGCGMSRGNAVSAQHICDLLNLIYTSDNYQTFHKTLAVAGESGTLARICKGKAGEGRIFAKTGTMNRTKSFIGYVHTQSGKKLTFAFTIVNFDCSTWEMTGKMVRILNTMAES